MMLSVIDVAVREFAHNYDAYIRMGELAALICAMGALIFAGKQYIDSRDLATRAKEQTDKLTDLGNRAKEQTDTLTDLGKRAKEQTDKLLDVANSLPTRYVGKFPDNTSALANLVRDAQHELLILVDFVGYGYYSDPPAFKRYYRELQRQAINEGVDLTVICYDKMSSEQRVEDQFEKRGDFAKEATSPAFINFYTKYFKEQFAELPKDWATFNEDRLKCEEGYRHDLHINKVRMFETSARLPFLAWVRDKEEAIISLQSLTAIGDVSFQTADKEFVQFFRDQILHISKKDYVRTMTPALGALLVK